MIPFVPRKLKKCTVPPYVEVGKDPPAVLPLTELSRLREEAPTNVPMGTGMQVTWSSIEMKHGRHVCLGRSPLTRGGTRWRQCGE
jgi:hypothetical protein